MLRFGRTLVAAATTSVVGATSLLTGYLGLLTVAAMLPRPRSRARTAAPVRHRFAILVPAHDEETIIGRALEAFAALDYPRDRFEVHVVADNCTDRTADVVRGAGFEAHERIAPAAPGKGAALNWLVEIVESHDVPPDAYVIVDADTTLDAAFLTEMDDALCDGASAAQGYYAVSDPDTSTAAGLRFAALACRHHLRPLGRNRLGASCGLYGNGMVFRRALMRDRRWSGHLVEDAEFQMELLLDGQLVTYVPGAALHAEMPDTLEGSVSQNQRWELGRLQVARRFVPPLARRAIGSRRGMRVAYVDAIFDHAVPPLSVLALAQAAACVGAGALAALGGGRSDRRRLAIALASAGTLSVHVVAALASVGAPRAVWRSLLGAPRAVLWKAGLWFGVMRAPDDVAWTRTERNRQGGLP